MHRSHALPFLALALFVAGCGGFTQIGEGSGGTGGDGGQDDESGGTSGSSSQSGASGSGANGGSSSGAGTGASAGRSGGGGQSGSANTAGTGGGAYEPCAGKPCGSQCSLCAPDDLGCAETAVIKFCDASGTCGSNSPNCGPTSCGESSECTPPTSDGCRACEDGSIVCPTVQCVDGECRTSYPTCATPACTTDEDCPQSLAPCQPCPDGSSACPWSRCDDGVCTSGIDSCDEEDPCAGKACGDVCSPCGAEDCVTAPALAYCDQNLVCQLSTPECAFQCETHDECNMTDDCPLCPGVSGCATRSCVDGACVLECPDPSPDLCGGCATGETCVYQQGGPGPAAGWVCAETTLCLAVEACACILGQGTCAPQYGTEGTDYYCLCDNGLD